MSETADPQQRHVLTSVIGIADVDRNSPVPLYYQVAQRLEKAIEGGVMPPGTRLDNEVQLAASLGLSRPTMRQAMQLLVDRGLIVRRRGLGTRVVQPKVRRSLELTSLYDDLQASKQEPTTQVLSLSVAPPSPEVAGVLRLGPDDLVFSLVRLRAAEGRPIARLTNFVPASLLDMSHRDLERHGLYKLFRAAGIVLHSAHQTIGATVASAEEAELLDEDGGAALLTMERTAYDDHGTPVELGRHIYVAGRYSFEMSLLAT